MATINLLPNATKRAVAAGKKFDFQALLKFSRYLLIIPALILLALLIIAAAMSAQVKNNEKRLAALEQKITGLGLSMKEIANLDAVKKELAQKLAFYQGALGNGILWSEKLSSINNAIPPQVWLTAIEIEKKKTLELAIKGSATSAVDSEIIASISEFSARLKKDVSFMKDFEEIEMGPVVSDESGKLAVVKFTLYCKFKRQ
ncbi:MAG: PilN domain-containing protein [Candidatus Omnitrophota bacterium]|nr:PilN domain-containing protein [Candidatus Omnitrophota bacterium]